MGLQAKQPARKIAKTVEAATPGTPREEKQQHTQALFRGKQLLIIAGALLAIFGLVTAAVLLLNPQQLDLPITKEVQETNFRPIGWLMEAISWPGFMPWNFVFPIIIILGIALLRRFAEAAFLALATALSGLSEVVKALVHRVRPDATLVNVIGHPTGSSFPSGHVTEYTLFFGFLFYLIFTLLPRSILKTILLVFCGLMVGLVGISRIWLGAHWASDVLGGYTFGFGLLLLVIWGYRGWEVRQVKKPAARERQTAHKGTN
jgi:membrane-associated phospholipid phosphatase